MVLIAGRTDVLQFGEGVEGTLLGGLGEIDQTGLDDMLMGGVLPVVPAGTADLLSGDFPLLGRQRQHLVAAGLDGSCLVDVDVSRLCAQGSLVGPQDGGDHGGVGLGTAHQKFHRRIRGLAGLADKFPGVIAVGVHTVARRLLQIGLGQGLQNFGVGPLPVVTFKAYHVLAPFPPFGKGACFFLSYRARHNSARIRPSLFVILHIFFVPPSFFVDNLLQ